MECFSEVADPRSEKARVHRLSDILALAVLAVIAGAEGWEDIEEFGKQQHAWLKRFLRLPGGVPSHAPSAGCSACSSRRRSKRALAVGSSRCTRGWG